MSMEKSQGMDMSMERTVVAKEPPKVTPPAFGAAAVPSFGQTGFGFGAKIASIIFGGCTETDPVSPKKGPIGIKKEWIIPALP